MIATPPVERMLLGEYRCISSPLDCLSMEDLLPEVMAIALPLLKSASGADGLTVLDGMTGVCTALAGGKLKHLLPQLLATTSVIVPTGTNGALERIDVGRDDQRNKAFTGRMRLWRAVIQFAVEVNFKDFLPDGGLSAVETPTA